MRRQEGTADTYRRIQFRDLSIGELYTPSPPLLVGQSLSLTTLVVVVMVGLVTGGGQTGDW